MAVSPPAVAVPSSGSGSTPMKSVIGPQRRLDDAEHLTEVFFVRTGAGGPDPDLAGEGRAGKGRPAIHTVWLVVLRSRERQQRHGD